MRKRMMILAIACIVLVALHALHAQQNCGIPQASVTDIEWDPVQGDMLADAALPMFFAPLFGMMIGGILVFSRRKGFADVPLSLYRVER